jgi:hypothetical protein
MLTPLPRRIAACMVAACAVLSLAAVADAQQTGNRPRPPQPSQAAPPAPSAPATAPSSKRVLTEQQKYCRANNGCKLDGSPCPKCPGK